jgi:alkylation response protein AidB-like acyl-CoA dehydrogenase
MTTIERPGTDIRDFHTDTKSRRYDTGRYTGATGLNWWTADPTLQFLAGFYLDEREQAVARPYLEAAGALLGGPVSERAELTDKHPPYLVKYDRWGHDISEVVMPASMEESKREIIAARRRLSAAMHAQSVRTSFTGAAFSYMLNQAEVGMSCALGTGLDMIADLVDKYAPADNRDSLMPRIEAGEFDGETAQMLTERTGGSDLGQLETTATPHGDAYLLNGVKWFASNANGKAFVVLAKPEGATDDVKGVNSFLVLLERRDGSRNGVYIRQLKDKLGTKAVASCEIEFKDAEAFILSGKSGNSDGRTGDGAGLSRMMALTNGSRIGVAMMGLGCARRALVESLCYARAREAFGQPILQHPLMRRKLAELIVEVEATQALVFDSYAVPNRLRPAGAAGGRLRLTPALVKLKAARLGITAASDAIEVHGGNGYCETWPVARILRDAQVNTVWEGTDNILCLDVRRSIEREGADVPFIARLREAVANAGEGDSTTALVSDRITDLENAVASWKTLERHTAEARLFPLAQFMIDVYAGALLLEQAKWDSDHGGTRKALVARLWAQAHLAEGGPLRGIDKPDDEALAHFDELVAGALTFDQP